MDVSIARDLTDRQSMTCRAHATPQIGIAPMMACFLAPALDTSDIVKLHPQEVSATY